MAQLLVSVQSVTELELAWNAGIRWLDLKDPTRGSLGAPSRQIAEAVGSRFVSLATPFHDAGLNRLATLSLAAGELKDRPRETWLAGDVFKPYHFVKIALAGCRDWEIWQKEAAKFAAELTEPRQLILVHYADWERANAPSFDEVLGAAIENGSQFLLVDTWKKDGLGLLHWYDHKQLLEKIHHCHEAGIRISLAGSLSMQDLELLGRSSVDVLAVRGAACIDSQRGGELCAHRLADLTSWESQLSHFSSEISSNLA